MIDGLQPDEDGKPSIDITFSYDASGCLTVEATDIQTGKSKQITFEAGSRKPPTPTQKPVDFVLMMDASGSMGNYNRMTEAKEASRRLVNELIDFRVHRMGLISFGSSAKSIVGLTDDQEQLRRGIESLTTSGTTAMDDALRHMERMFDRQDDRKHVGILVSDGEPDDEDKTVALAQSLRKDGIRLIFIGVGPNVNELDVAEPEDTYSIQNMHDLSDKFDTIIPGITNP